MQFFSLAAAKDACDSAAPEEGTGTTDLDVLCPKSPPIRRTQRPAVGVMSRLVCDRGLASSMCYVEVDSRVVSRV